MLVPWCRALCSGTRTCLATAGRDEALSRAKQSCKYLLQGPQLCWGCVLQARLQNLPCEELKQSLELCQESEVDPPCPQRCLPSCPGPGREELCRLSETLGHWLRPGVVLTEPCDSPGRFSWLGLQCHLPGGCLSSLWVFLQFEPCC